MVESCVWERERERAYQEIGRQSEVRLYSGSKAFVAVGDLIRVRERGMRDGKRERESEREIW